MPHTMIEPIEDSNEPQPIPWYTIPSLETLQCCYLLTQVAALIRDDQFSKELIQLAAEIAGGVTSRVVKEIEESGKKSRPISPAVIKAKSQAE
jgi:hypothetical protein